jgi:circadian clock protein KaiC
MSSAGSDLGLHRVPTAVEGLDRVLLGGLLRGGVYIVEGAPGAGKTVLANQICFNHVARHGCAVFVTLLAESHARMLQHLQPMEFYNESAIPDGLYYISGFTTLESEGLKGVIDLLRREIKAHHASLLVLDGFATTEESAGSKREFKKFVHEIQTHAAVSDCTVLVLTNGSAGEISPEYTMVDGVIEINDTQFAPRTARTLRVRKFRGSGFLPGDHALRISAKGIEIFPRIEAAFATPSVRDVFHLQRQSTGVEGVDALLHGGLMARTTNGLYGPTGAGKTTFGLQFVSRSSAAEPGVFFGFFESPDRLCARASTLGIDLAGMQARGEVEIIWCPQGEHILDELGHKMIDAVRRRGARRLFIDGYGGLVESAVHPERITRFVSVLGNEIRALGATTVVSIESRNIIGASMELPSQGLSSLLEGLIVMRYTEVDGEVRRLLSITKIRDSSFDPFLHEFQIAERGIEVTGRFSGVEAVLSGYARVPKAVPAGEGPQESGKRE